MYVNYALITMTIIKLKAGTPKSATMRVSYTSLLVVLRITLRH